MVGELFFCKIKIQVSCTLTFVKLKYNFRLGYSSVIKNLTSGFYP
jgi:hypothetical protein